MLSSNGRHGDVRGIARADRVPQASRVVGVMNENRDSADGDAPYIAMVRALAGESTPEEREAFRRDLEAALRRAELFAALDCALRPLSAAPADTHEVDVEAALARVLSRRDARPVFVAA